MRRPLLLAVVYFVFSLGVTSAQPPLTQPEVTFTAAAPSGLLEPDRGRMEIPLTFRMTCPLPPSVTTYQVSLRPSETPEYATVILNPPSFTLAFQPDQCVQSTSFQEGTVDAIVTTSRHAPAYVMFTTTIEASVTNGENTYGPYEVDFTITNDYVPLSVINPSQLFIKAGQGAKVVFPVEIHNMGNGKSRYELVATPANGSSFAQIDVEPEIVLESAEQVREGGTYRRTTIVELITNRGDVYENRLERLEVTINGRSAGRGNSTSETHQLTLAVQVQGGSSPTPFPLFGPAAVAVLVAVLVSRTLRARSGPS